MGIDKEPHFIIIGGGLGGALMAGYLGKAGRPVDLYEKRSDPRLSNGGEGRSINLALSTRGIESLEHIGAAEEVLRQAIPMRGRMIHSPSGQLSFQRYGRDDTQMINSVSRSGLNAALLSAAERFPSVRIHFDHKCQDVDLDGPSAKLVNTKVGETVAVEGDVLIGADGAFSAVRRSMQGLDRFNYQQDYIAHGYKELHIPPGANGEFRMEKNALHIWPRRSFMMIALPNADGSFTCTLFWPFEGHNSFAALGAESDVLTYFQRTFPDAVPLMPSLAQDFMSNPVGSLVTIRCSPWSYGDKVVLLGDACHAVVPFYGQGANAAFEDCPALFESIAECAPDWKTAFRRYHDRRKAHVDTLADLALRNFIEMRDHTGSRVFLMKKKLERTLHKLFPKWYIPLYTLVTFTRTPYAEAVRRAKAQNRIVGLAGGTAALIVIVAILLMSGAWR